MDNLFYKNGKAKKKYCACLTWYRKELNRLYHEDIIQCAGSNCPYYVIGECGRENLNEWDKKKGI